MPPPIASRFGNEDGKSDIIRDGWTTEIICRKHTNNPQLTGAPEEWERARVEERCYNIVDDSIADNGTWLRPAARIGNERFPRDHSGNGMMGNDKIV